MDELVFRLLKRAEIRRSIPRGEPDRISDLLEEAANRIELLEMESKNYKNVPVTARISDGTER